MTTRSRKSTRAKPTTGRARNVTAKAGAPEPPAESPVVLYRVWDLQAMPGEPGRQHQIRNARGLRKVVTLYHPEDPEHAVRGTELPYEEATVFCIANVRVGPEGRAPESPPFLVTDRSGHALRVRSATAVDETGGALRSDQVVAFLQELHHNALLDRANTIQARRGEPMFVKNTKPDVLIGFLMDNQQQTIDVPAPAEPAGPQEEEGAGEIVMDDDEFEDPELEPAPEENRYAVADAIGSLEPQAPDYVLEPGQQHPKNQDDFRKMALDSGAQVAGGSVDRQQKLRQQSKGG